MVTALVAAVVSLGFLLLPNIGRAMLGCVLVVVICFRAIRRGPEQLPQRRRIIPTEISARGGVGAVQFGFDLGSGVRTYSPSVLPISVLCLSVTVGGPVGVGCAALGFAIGRISMASARMRTKSPAAWTSDWNSAQRLIEGAGVVAVAIVLGSTVWSM